MRRHTSLNWSLLAASLVLCSSFTPRLAVADPGDLLHTLVSPAPATGGNFGKSLAAAGPHALVGDFSHSPGGAAHLFDATTGDLVRTFSNPAPGQTGFGWSVTSFRGNVVGGSLHVAAHLLDSAGGGLLQTFPAPANAGSQNRFADSVAAVGGNILVGAPWDNTAGETFQSGAAYLFDAATGGLLHTFRSPVPFDEFGLRDFGVSVAALGDNVLVGSPGDDTARNDAGAVHLFDARSGELVRTFLHLSPWPLHHFGASVASVGGNVLVGVPGDNTGAFDAGAAYLFDGETGDLLQTFLNPSPAQSDAFGSAVAAVGGDVLIGADEDDPGGFETGAAYLFDGATGTLLHTFVDPTPANFEHFGSAVAAVGGNILINGVQGDPGGPQTGAAYLFEGPGPVIRWDNPGSSAWSVPGNWDLRVTPQRDMAVFVQPAGNLTVSLVTSGVTVRELNLGAINRGTAVLELFNQVLLTVTDETLIERRGRIIGDGTLYAAGGITNRGEIDFGGGGLQVEGGTLTNHGLLHGEGRIGNSLANAADGEVRGQSGQRLLLTGTGNTNAGEINLGGGTVEFARELTNQVTGFIAGRGELRAGGGLVNNGVVALSGGLTDVYGEVTNNAGARIVTSGGGTTTFYNDVTDAGGEMRVSANSNVVFFGAYNGGTTGAGDAFVEGDLRPGDSPAAADFGGAVHLAATASVTIEIGGSTPGDEYDQINIADGTTLAGALNVLLIDDFTPSYQPAPGDEFVVMTYASRSGEFDTVNLPDLASGVPWQVDYGDEQLTLRVLSIPGDVNFDGIVDPVDFATLVRNLGNSDAQFASGDLDGDNAVTLFDLAILQANLGQTLSAPAASIATVPEPSALTLVALAVAALTMLGRPRVCNRCSTQA